jgi:phenylalanyl-tRNA synthetase beta chain
LQEVISYPLTTTDLLAAVQPPDALEVHPPLRLENPMSSEQAVMRTSLRASLLQTVAANLRRERGTVAVFEAARAYLSAPGALPDEREAIVAAIGGQRRGRWGQPANEPLDFFDAKGILEEVLDRAGVDVAFRPAEEYALLRGRTAEVTAGEERAGVIGQVHPQVATRFGIEGPVFLFELDVARLLTAVRGQVRHQSLSRYPAVIQDIAVLVDLSVEAAQVARLIAASPLVVEAQLFDVYEGPPMPEGKRSLAFAVHFQSQDRTLTDAEVADARRRIIRRLEHELGAELRGA